MAIKRIYVEKRAGFRVAAESLKNDVFNTLGIKLDSLRVILRYDADGIDEKNWKKSVENVFSEPPADDVYESVLPPFPPDTRLFGVEFLPGQYDQRADSAAQCVQLLTRAARPVIRCATLYAVSGATAEQFDRIKRYLINPVEARECAFGLPESLYERVSPPEPVTLADGFVDMTEPQLAEFHRQNGFAMTLADLIFVQAHFKAEYRNPTHTELKVIDTYWSDHCRHTTFTAALGKVTIKSDISAIDSTFRTYLALFNRHHKGRADKYKSLMDMATIGARELKSRGLLENLDESDEINACSIRVTALVDGEEEPWLVMFKNETHNHPTEIEPFGGAATCLGGAIRDPLSGRVYVYQAMRVTGAADINAPFSKTLKGKLPQRVISKTAAKGFSSYGNQIGLATGIVSEVYHPGYAAKRLEAGFVVGAAPAKNVVRATPAPGDAVVLIGGETGRDGCGGATGSSKAHTVLSTAECGAEVQKGNPLTERKIQRLFRNPDFTRLVKRCNDFGAGGVSVAVGELAPGLDIDLDAVPKKYSGLSATELAISESQERMAVVVAASDLAAVKKLCADENLNATPIAAVTDSKRMRMTFAGRLVVDLPRRFLDSNGVRGEADAVIKDQNVKYFAAAPVKGDPVSALKNALAAPNTASQKGLSEMFDSTIGAGTVLMPFGGATQQTPAIAMAAKLPAKGETDVCTVASWGYLPELSCRSPFLGAVYAVVLSVVKTVVAGAPLSTVRLTFQEFFEKLAHDPERWGKPVAALLGALNAQLNLGTAAIGGKDSMSGSFEKLDVPPTLISFALGIAKASEVTVNTFTAPNQRVYRYSVKRDADNMPDYAELTDFLRLFGGEAKRGRISYAQVVENGGVAAAVAKSCFGNTIGFDFADAAADIFAECPADVLLCPADPADFVGYGLEFVGETSDLPLIRFSDGADAPQIALADALNAYNGTFSAIYPTRSRTDRQVGFNAQNAKRIIFAKQKFAAPRVFIPVFPGTNCEYDTAKRFSAAGAKPVIFVVKNRSQSDIKESVDAMAALIADSQIIAFPGGFSGGDEPDGSGKFIASMFRNKKLSDAVRALIQGRDGLILGICNGFQALIKLGLLPYGKIAPLKKDSPTLTFNDISRHVSTIVNVRVASALSPWFAALTPGEVYAQAVSHGEGKFVASDSDLAALAAAGQIATQYADECGAATMQSPFNPNGSYAAVEGITSADGRILGKMGHSERIGSNLMKNIGARFDMKIFESGVKYYK
ncbi:MAG: phosphoribosylformylglycinamidine synthase [Clostridiales bacterium]|jgi:phosphoribosylformylglycinamidine synthase|nr:phosphoribosylformylglycinamidine synthase [Clostridiales bacterium]